MTICLQAQSKIKLHWAMSTCLIVLVRVVVTHAHTEQLFFPYKWRQETQTQPSPPGRPPGSCQIRCSQDSSQREAGCGCAKMPAGGSASASCHQRWILWHLLSGSLGDNFCKQRLLPGERLSILVSTCPEDSGLVIMSSGAGQVFLTISKAT